MLSRVLVEGYDAAIVPGLIERPEDSDPLSDRIRQVHRLLFGGGRGFGVRRGGGGYNERGLLLLPSRRRRIELRSGFRVWVRVRVRVSGGGRVIVAIRVGARVYRRASEEGGDLALLAEKG